MSDDYGCQFETTNGESVVAGCAGQVCVLGPQTLCYRHYEFGLGGKVVQRIRAGEPITAAMGTRAKVIPVESIISVGKSETLNSTIIAYAAGGKDKFIRITTPKLSLYGKVFDMVRMRLGPNQPVREGPCPFGFYCTIFGIFGLVLGIMAAGLCGIAADAQRGNMQHRLVGHGPSPKANAIATVAAAIAETIGLRNTILLSCAILVTYVGNFILFFLRNRTMKVVRFSRSEGNDQGSKTG